LLFKASKRAILAAVLLTFILGNQSIAQLSDQQTKEIQAMHWAPASGFRLIDSKSSLENLPDFRLIAGPEARRFREMIDGKSDSQQEVDAFNPTTNSELIYEWFPNGFVTSDDWANVDPDNFLSQLKEHDVEAG
jgi:hypothetical protein